MSTSQGNIKLLNIDCMAYMATLPDKAFDLAIVDPPYGIGAGKMTMGSGKHKFTKDKSWDSATPSAVYWNELFRVSANQIVWGGNYFTEYLPPSPHWLIWDKNNPNLSFAEGEMAWVRYGNNLRIFQHYSAQVEGNGKIHPTQKPVRLYKWILNRYAKEGDRILDTHLGSGSSAIAAFDFKAKEFVGCEIDKDYYNAAVNRFRIHTSQYQLF
jgi:site-specific DNA-methyltransferase (adenine-specific)